MRIVALDSLHVFLIRGNDFAGSIPALIGGLSDSEEYVRRISLYTVSRLGPNTNQTFLGLWARRQMGNRAGYAPRPIGAWPPEAVPVLTNLIRYGDAKARDAVARALRQIASHSGTAATLQ